MLLISWCVIRPPPPCANNTQSESEKGMGQFVVIIFCIYSKQHETPSEETIGAPIGCSGVQIVPKKGQSFVCFVPRIISPAMHCLFSTLDARSSKHFLYASVSGARRRYEASL